MPRRFAAEDRQVLRLKLKQAAALVDVYEEKIDRCRSLVATAVALDVSDDAPQLLHRLKEGLIPISETGTATSSILGDLDRARSELGLEWLAENGRLERRVTSGMVEIARSQSAVPVGNTSAFRGVVKLAGDVLDLLVQGVKPAALLRRQLAAELRRRAPRAGGGTERQQANKLRDSRFRLLKKEHPKLSYADILKLADTDPVLKQLKNKTVFSRDTVREALRKRRGKKRDPKSHVK